MKPTNRIALSLLLALGLAACRPAAEQSPSAPAASAASEAGGGMVQTASDATMADLAQPLSDYKVYVQAEAKALVAKTADFAAAVKAGDVEKAKALYADTRSHYERIEPVAELFNELDLAIDAREDDYKAGPKDPEFTGFHRIEYALWVEKSTAGVQETADKLVADVNKLQSEIDVLDFPPEKVVGGAAELIEEVAASKISGEENRYSSVDLSDFQANVEGAQKIFELFRPQIVAKNPPLAEQIDADFKQVNEALAKYRTDGGFAPYNQLSEADRKAMQAPINALAEGLAQLRGTLGLN
nr:iron uptake system protein EfeO [Neisseria sp. 3986]MDD9325767.1 iron uptake system protein EfeO [Neisseria sp. 3986]